MEWIFSFHGWQSAGNKEILSKGKGESYDEICFFGTDDVVLMLFNHRYVFYGIGRIRTLAAGSSFQDHRDVATAFLAALSLFFFGGEVIHNFAFAIVAGIIICTYSSIFVASPIVAILGERAVRVKA
jgi:hypothetical protein